MFGRVLKYTPRAVRRTNFKMPALRGIYNVNVNQAQFSTEIRRVVNGANDEVSDTEIPYETYDPTASCSMANIKLDGSTRRFYRDVSVTHEGDGKYAVRLGNNIALTPVGHQFILPNKAYAMMCALEFQNQKIWIYPHTMPLTNLALTVLDRLPHDREEMIQNCLAILEFDSTLYRENREDAPGLVRLQEKHFDPLLKWMLEEFNAPLKYTFEMEAIEQDPQTFVNVEAVIRAMDDYTFAAFEAVTFLGKSTVIALALIRKRINIEQCFKAARLEENYQIKMCGRVTGIYGTVIPEEHAKLRIASCRTALNLLEYDLAKKL